MSVSRTRDYQSNVVITRNIIRASSPTTLRLESRVKELDDLLDLEREARLRAERNATELSMQLTALNERVELMMGSEFSQNEAVKKRDAEIARLRRELDSANQMVENSEAGLRRKYHTTVAELSSEIEQLQKAKGKAEKDRSTLKIEIDGAFSQLDQALQAKSSAESRLDGLQSQLNRLKNLVEDLQRQTNEANGARARLQSENTELQRALQEYELQLSSANKARTSLQLQYDEMRSGYDEAQRSALDSQAQLLALRQDHDALLARYEEESEAAAALRAQNAKLNSDLAALKSRYDREILLKTEEMEELRRRLTLRITELEDTAERERSRANNLERAKSQLTIQLNELQIEYDNIVVELGDLQQQLKGAEAQIIDMQRIMDDMNNELNQLRSQNASLSEENARLKSELGSARDKLANLERENRHLNDQLKEAKHALQDATRRVSELEALRLQLESERDNLAAALHDAESALRELEQKYQALGAAYAHTKADLEAKLKEKTEELETLRRTTRIRIEELTLAISEMEAKHLAELSRLKKKYEASIADLEAQLNALRHANAMLSSENRTLVQRVKELEAALDEEHRLHEITLASLQTSERKRAQLAGEVEELRTQFELADRAKKAAQNEAAEATTRVSELTVQVTGLTNDRRRLETENGLLRSDLDEAVKARQAAEDRATQLNGELNRLGDELRREQENFKRAESLRHTLEVEVRELNVRLEESEALSAHQARQVIQKLQNRIRELEGELDVEMRRAKESHAQARKFERQLKEVQQQADDDRRMVLELQDVLDKTQLKMRQYKSRVEEAEDVVSITMNKYRKAQQTIDDMEHRADITQRSLTIRRAGSVAPVGTVVVRSGSVPHPGVRAVSVVREVNTSNNVYSVAARRGVRALSTR